MRPFVCCGFTLLLALQLEAQPAVRTNPGFYTGSLEEGDSSASPLQQLGFTANFYGSNYSAVSVNSDGMVTLGVINALFRYTALRALSQPAITPFWTDSYALANTVFFGRDTVDSRPAFAATWNGLGPSPGAASGPRNVFQLVLIDRSNIAPGDFDFEFNYNSIRWECSNNNSECVAGTGFGQARAGWTSGTGASTLSAYELDGSAEAGGFLDSNPLGIGLRSRFLDSSGVLGRLLFQVRGGVVQNAGRPPQITSITNAASFAPNFAPNSFFTIFGSNFTTLAGPWDRFVRSGELPSAIRDLRVKVNDQDAYISYFTGGQLNVLAPPGNYSGNLEIQVTNRLGTATRIVTVNRISPGWFGYRTGTRFYPSALFANTVTFVAPTGSLAPNDSRPCRSGDTIVLYATGLGPTNPAPASGQVLAAPLPIDNPNRIRVILGGQTAALLYAGMTFAGAFQLNVTIPSGIGTGDLPLRLEVDGVPAQEAYLNCSN